MDKARKAVDSVKVILALNSISGILKVQPFHILTVWKAQADAWLSSSILLRTCVQLQHKATPRPCLPKCHPAACSSLKSQ